VKTYKILQGTKGTYTQYRKHGLKCQPLTFFKDLRLDTAWTLIGDSDGLLTFRSAVIDEDDRSVKNYRTITVPAAGVVVSFK